VRARLAPLLVGLALAAVPTADAASGPTAHAARQYLSFGAARAGIRATLRTTYYGYEEGSLEAGCWRYKRGYYDRVRCLIDWRDADDGTLWAGCARVVKRTYYTYSSVYRIRVASDPRAPAHGADCS
jgi:hypothetical protein